MLFPFPTKFLKEAYEVDKSLYREGYKSWHSSIQNSMHKLNVSETNMIYSTDRSKAVVPVLIVALWFILRGDLFEALPCVILFLRVSVL